MADYIEAARGCLNSPVSGFWFDADMEVAVLVLINAAREEAGLAPVALRPELAAPARLHSLDMGQDWFFDHVGPDGRRATDRVAALDRTLIQSELRENIAKIGGSIDWSRASELFHNLLMNSDGHRKNILAEKVTHVGLGIARDGKDAWLTQIFVRQDGVLEEPVPARLAIGQSYAIAALLDQWTFGGAWLQEPPAPNFQPAPALPLTPNKAYETARLRIRGERREGRQLSWAMLNGPAVTVEASPPS